MRDDDPTIMLELQMASQEIGGRKRYCYRHSPSLFPLPLSSRGGGEGEEEWPYPYLFSPEEKSPSFKVTDINTIKACMQSHVQATKGISQAAAMSSGDLDLEHANLEKQQFELDINMINSDVKKYRVWFQKSTDRLNSEYYHKLEWQKSYTKAGRDFGEKWVDSRLLLLQLSDGSGSLHSSIEEFQTRAENEVFMIRGSAKASRTAKGGPPSLPSTPKPP